MQATLQVENLLERVTTSSATVSAVSGSYQNWLSLQSSVTSSTLLESSPPSREEGGGVLAAVLFWSARNSWSAASA